MREFQEEILILRANSFQGPYVDFVIAPHLNSRFVTDLRFSLVQGPF